MVQSLANKGDLAPNSIRTCKNEEIFATISQLLFDVY